MDACIVIGGEWERKGRIGGVHCHRGWVYASDGIVVVRCAGPVIDTKFGKSMAAKFKMAEENDECGDPFRQSATLLDLPVRWDGADFYVAYKGAYFSLDSVRKIASLFRGLAIGEVARVGKMVRPNVATHALAFTGSYCGVTYQGLLADCR